MRHFLTEHFLTERRMRILFWLVLSGLLRLDSCSSQDTSCQVCVYGPPSVPLTEKLLPPDIEIPLVDCFDLGVTATLLESDSDLCGSVQSFGTYCGCNRAPDACNLCWDGSAVTRKDQLQNVYNASDFLGVIGAGVGLNCETLESFVHSLSNSSSQCLEAQEAAGVECGCPPLPTDTPNNGDGRNDTNITLPPEEPETELDPPTPNTCTLCANGDPVPLPDHRPVVVAGTNAISCSAWEALALSSEEGSDDCRLIRSVSVLCGCPKPEGACTMCPLGEPVPNPTQELNWLSETFLSISASNWLFGATSFLTCGLMESAVAVEASVISDVFATAGELVCTAAQMKSWICGCQPDWRPIFLTWAYRSSAILSFLVSKSHIYYLWVAFVF